jgi:probable HAF family extracellular repeat protein
MMLKNPIRTGSRRINVAATSAVLLASASSLIGQITPLSLTVLEGPAGFLTTSALSVNESGQVAGLATFPSSVQHAILYSGGVTTDLGTLSSGTQSSAQSINASGQIAGLSATNVAATQHAFLYSGGPLQDIHTAGSNTSQAFGINDSGAITGARFVSSPTSANRAFVRSSTGVTTTLGTLGGNTSSGRAINNSGQVTGDSNLATSGPSHAFLYSGSGLVDLGTFGGATSSGRAINDLGQVTGTAATAISGQTHAFLYSGSGLVDLGTLGGATSTGNGINDLGQVVGISVTASNQQRAFLYSGGTMYNLQDAFASLMSDGTSVGFSQLTTAADISDSGWIVGTGLYRTASGANVGRGFIARIQQPSATVPDTGCTVALLGLASACAALSGLRRHRASRHR